nr:hypothetical protein [uncultured Brevundimonas sp.]
MALVSYWLSFSVKKAPSRTKGDDNKRRQSIYDAISAWDGAYWDETTSFALFDAPASIVTVARAIVAGLDPALDKIVIRRVGAPVARYWGAVDYPANLESYIDNIERLV